MKTPDPRAHSASLDALRGVAILGVVACHVAARWSVGVGEPLTVPLLGVDAVGALLYGSYGVSLFFLLSGYLLTWTEEKRAGAGAYSVRAYALRRVLRLVPAYYVALMVVFVAWPTSPSAAQAVPHLLFLQSFDHLRASLFFDPIFWSLTPEVAFYCLLPLLVLKLTGASRRLALFGALVLVSLATRVYVGWFAPDPLEAFRALYYLPTTHLWLFLAGVLLRGAVERAERQPGGATPLWGSPRFASALFLASAGAFLAFPLLGVERDPALGGLVGMIPDLAVIGFFASAVLGAPPLRGVLRWRPLVLVGVVSYSTFLLHGTVLRLAADRAGYPARFGGLAGDGASAWWAFSAYAACVLAAALAVSALSYRFVEAPFLRRKPKW